MTVRASRAIPAVLLVLVASGVQADRVERRIDRQLEFARKLGTLGYFDVADVVLERLEKDETVVGVYKSRALRAAGDFYAETAPLVAKARGQGLRGYIGTLEKARAFYRKHIAHRSTNAAGRFAARLRLSSVAFALAQSHLRLRERPRTPDAEKETHKQQALAIFRNAVDGLRLAAEGKEKELAAARSRERRDVLRQEHLRAQLAHLNGRVRLVRHRKALGAAPAREWQSELNACEKAYIQLLLDWANTPAEIEANLHLGICLVEQGPKRDGDARMRFEGVWRRRAVLRHFKRIPCEAAYWRAFVLKRQERFGEAIGAIDSLLRFASGGVWEKGEPSVEKVVATLEELEGVDREQYGQPAAASAVMLQAEAYAALAAQAEGNERKALYRVAYDIGTGVCQFPGLRRREYAPLLAKWRVGAHMKWSPPDLWYRYQAAVDSQNYALAARHYTWLILRGAVPRERVRQAWLTVGRRYHQAERFYQSAIVFSAVARWFPRPQSQALAAARAAVRAMAQRHGATKASFDDAYLRRLRRRVEALDPSVYPAVTLAEARAAREAGRFGEALDLLGRIAPMRKGYAEALYEIALTHKARLAQAGAQGRRHTAAMDAAFEKLFEHCRNAAKTAEDDKARARLAEIAAAGIHALGDAYLRPQLSDPQKAIAHTSGLQARHPGIEGAPSYPLIGVVRLRAAHALVRQAKQAERVASLLAIVEETWRAANEQSNPHLGRAARTAGRVYLAAAAKFRAAGITRRARAARDRGAELYAESLRAEPKQPLRTYRFVLRVLGERGRPADQRIIVELAPRAIQLHGEPPEAFKDILSVKAILGIAHHGLGHYAKAIPFLREVESHYERAYQKALGRYRLDRDEYRRDPGKFPRPPQPPRRNACQPEVKEKLAYCYLATHRREQYGWLLKAYDVLDRIHARQPHKRWPVRYNLVETYRRLGNYERVVGLMDRWHFQTGGTMGGPASKRRLRRLVGHVALDVKKLDDAVRRATLLRQVAEVRGLLGRL